MRTIFAVALVLASSSLGGVATASCIQQSVAEQAEGAQVVVYGRIEVLEGRPGAPSRFALVRVERVLKGSALERIGVALGPGGGGPAPAATSVDYTVRQGEDHTLYMRRAAGGFETDACAGSHAGPPTAEETALLGAGTAPDRAPTGVSDATPGDRAVAAIAALAALAAGVVAIAYARRSAREVAS